VIAELEYQIYMTWTFPKLICRYTLTEIDDEIAAHMYALPGCTIIHFVQSEYIFDNDEFTSYEHSPSSPSSKILEGKIIM